MPCPYVTISFFNLVMCYRSQISLNKVSMDDPSEILYPLDFVFLERCIPWMMRLFDNASLTDGSCYSGTDWLYAGLVGSDCRGESFWSPCPRVIAPTCSRLYMLLPPRVMCHMLLCPRVTMPTCHVSMCYYADVLFCPLVTMPTCYYAHVLLCPPVMCQCYYALVLLWTRVTMPACYNAHVLLSPRVT
jgi:hypothetical protein